MPFDPVQDAVLRISRCDQRPDEQFKLRLLRQLLSGQVEQLGQHLAVGDQNPLNAAHSLFQASDSLTSAAAPSCPSMHAPFEIMVSSPG